MDNKRQLFDYQTSIPGPARIVVTDANGQRYELLVNFNLQQIDDLGTKDAMERTEFGLHFAISYSSRLIRPGEIVRGDDGVNPMKVDW